MGFKTPDATGAGPHDLLSATHTDTVTASPVAGDMVIGNTTPAWERLPVGEVNQHLVVASTGLPSWADETPSALAGFFLLDAASDIGGYKALTTSIPTDPEASVTATITTADGVPQLVEEWATAVGFPGVTFIPDGVWHLHLHAEQTGGSEDVSLSAEFYTRTAGGVETLIATSDNSPDLTADPAPYDIHTAIPEFFLDATDRIVMKVYGTPSGLGTNPSIAIYYEGDTASRLELPISTTLLDHGLLLGLDDDDHLQYLLASDATDRATFAANWTDLTDTGATTLHKHDHGGLDGLADNDHSQYTARIPGGRLTLTSATPVMTADVTDATNIYYTPYLHNRLAVWDGTSWVPLPFTELTNDTTDNTKNPAAVANNSNYDLFVWSDAGTLRLGRGPAWTSATARGTGAGTSELERLDGQWCNKIAITNGPAAQRGLYVGTVRSNGTAKIDYVINPVPAASAAECKINVWNMYNRVLVTAHTTPSDNDWTYATAAWRIVLNSATFRVSFVRGLDEDGMYANYGVETNSNGTSDPRISIGVDLTNSIGQQAASLFITANTIFLTFCVQYAGQPGLGYHYVTPLEYCAGGTATFYGDQNAPTQIQAPSLIAITRA